MGAEPLLPSIRPVQKSLRLFPIGVRAPRPVTTTRFKAIRKKL